MENKKPWLSKTVWLNLVMGFVPFLSAFSPSAEAFIQNNLVSFGLVWGALGIILRMVTKDKIVLID